MVLLLIWSVIVLVAKLAGTALTFWREIPLEVKAFEILTQSVAFVWFEQVIPDTRTAVVAESPPIINPPVAPDKLPDSICQPLPLNPVPLILASQMGGIDGLPLWVAAQ